MILKNFKMKSTYISLLGILAVAVLLVSLMGFGTPAAADDWIEYREAPAQNTEDVYLIDTPEKLAWFNVRIQGGAFIGVPVNKYAEAKLTADISLAGHEWTPIANFYGVFDGGGHSISVSVESGSSHLIFGSNYGTIMNLGMESSDTIVGAGGGIVGSNSGTISNCFSSVSWNNIYCDMGCICGSNQEGGIVEYCYNTGSVLAQKGVRIIGGICSVNKGIIRDCYNTGIFTNLGGTGSYWGGIVGKLTSPGTVTRCYNFGMMVEGKHRQIDASSIGGWQGYGAGYSALVAGGEDDAVEVTDCYFMKNLFLIEDQLDTVGFSALHRAYPSYDEGAEAPYGFAGYIVDEDDADKIDFDGTYYAYYDVTNNHIIAVKLEGEGDGTGIVIDAADPSEVSFIGLTGCYMTMMTKTFYIVTVPAATTSVRFVNTDELQDFTFFLGDTRATWFHAGNEETVLDQVWQTWPDAYDAIEAQLANIYHVPAVVTYGQVQVIIENTTFPESEGAVWDGTLIDAWVDLESDDTMMDCIVRAADTIGAEVDGAQWNYISSIAGLGEFNGGYNSGWMGTLNDWFTNTGFSAVTVASGGLQADDEIRVMYTCDLGNDLGGTWDNNIKTIKSISFSNGTLSPVFDENTHEYVLTVPQGTDGVVVTPTATNKNFQVRTYLGDMMTGTEYRRTQTVPITDGDVITVICGYPAWASMNNSPYGDADQIPEETYTILVEVGCPAWDVNEDGTVNYLDLSVLREHWGESGTPGWIRADINDDGTVNYADLSLLREHYGE